MSLKCAFIGMGVMGYPMAGHMQQGGFTTTVYNRTAAKAQQWATEFGGDAAATPKAAATGADVILLCVGNDDDVRSVVYGEAGILAAVTEGTVVIDHTTASAELARELSDAITRQGGEFLDAPVSGGQQGAENGVLTTMIGGHEATLAKVDKVLACYAKTRQLMGPAGSGQLAKMVNQICIANVVQGVAEGLQLARAVGLDADKLVAAVSKGSAGSWQLENRYKTMWQGDYEHGFAVDWMRKDLAIALAEANRQGISLPATALIDQYYADIQQMGGSRWDTSSLLARLEATKTLKKPD